MDSGSIHCTNPLDHTTTLSPHLTITNEYILTILLSLPLTVTLHCRRAVLAVLMSSMRQDREAVSGSSGSPLSLAASSSAIMGSADGNEGILANTSSSSALSVVSLQPVIMSLLRGLPGVTPVSSSSSSLTEGLTLPTPTSTVSESDGGANEGGAKDGEASTDEHTPRPTDVSTSSPTAPPTATLKTTTTTTMANSARYAPLGDRMVGSVLPFATASKGIVPIEDAAGLAQRLLVLCRFVSFRGDPVHTTGVEVR